MESPSQNSRAPPLPPRPFPENANGMSNSLLNHNVNYNGFGGYGMNMGNFGNMYGNYHGGMGYMGGQYGYGAPPESNFARLAEEQSRGAFQSIESVVNAVSSVANMLSSTHNAVYSSFRAVIGVVEQFGRLKGQLTSVIVSLAIFRWLHRLWRWLLVMLRLKPANYASVGELAWSNAKLPYASNVLEKPNGSTVNWPAFIFWLVAIGGPWLIYKCVNQMVQAVEEKRKWATGNSAHYTAKALFDFQASSEQELSFMTGENLRVAPKEEQPRVRGWLLASSAEGTRIGLIPINYVKIVGRKSESPPLTTPVDSLDKFESAFKCSAFN